MNLSASIKPQKHVIFIDASLPDYQTLIDGLSETTDIVQVTPDQDGFQVMAEWAQTHSGYSAMHIVGHGSEGAQQLGNATLSQETLETYQAELSQIGKALTEDGDILLYGCHVAANQTGVDFIGKLAQVTGADIAASDDLTGSQKLGGNWILEKEVGKIEHSDQSNNIISQLKEIPLLLSPAVGTIDFGSTNYWTSETHTTDPSKTDILSSGIDVFVDNSGSSKTNIHITPIANISTSASDKVLAIRGAGSGVATFNDIKIKSNDGGAFALTTMKVMLVASSSIDLTFSAYKNNTVVSGSSFSRSFTNIISQTIDFSSETGFDDIDEIRITPASSSDQFDIHFDNIGIAAAAAPANNSPVITLPSSPSVSEDATSVAIADDIQIADDDAGDTQTVTLTIGGGTASLVTTTGLTGLTGNGTASISFSGSLTDVNNALDSLTFTPTADLSGTNAGSIQIQTDDGNSGTDDETITFDIAAVNDAPTITSSGNYTLTAVNEETPSTGVLISTILADSNISHADVDSGASSGIAVTATTGTGSWEFSTDNSNWTSFGSVSTSAALLLDSATYVRFTGGTEYSGSANFTFQAWDQTSDSASTNGSVQTGNASVNGTSTAFSTNSATASITVNAVDDAPTGFGAATPASFTEDTQGNLDLSGFTVADADSASVTITLTASAGTLVASSSGGVTVGGSSSALTLTGAPGAINTWLDTTSNVQYTGATNANGTGAATITITGADGTTSNVAMGSVSLNISAVNDAPTITSSGNYALTAVNEETSSTGVLISTILADSNISHADVDSGASSGIAVTATTGTGSWEFSTDNSNWTSFGSVSTSAALLLDSATYVRFTGGTEYSGSANFTFQAWDQTSGSASTNGSAQTGNASVNGTSTAFSTNNATTSITVNAVDDAPTGSGAATPASFTEDTQGNLDLSGFTVADADSASVTITLTASAGALAASSSGGVTVGGSSSALTLTGAPGDINTWLDTTSNVKYTGATDANGTGAATITITGADGTTSNVAMGSVSLNISAVDDAPTVSGVPDDSVILSVGQYLDLSASSVADVDTDPVTATLSVNSGVLTATSAGGNHSGGAAVVQTGSQTVTLTGSPAEVDAYLNDTSELTFTSTASTADVTLTVSVDDGVNSAVSDTATISVLDIVKPTAGNYTDSTNEDTAVTAFSNTELPTAEDSDIGTAQTVEYITIDTSTVTGGVLSLTGTPAGGTSTTGGITFTTTTGDLSGTANIAIGDISNLVFTPTTDLSGTGAASFAWTVTDSGGDTSPAATYTLDITEVNDAPTLTATGANPNFSAGGQAVALFSAAQIDTVESGQGIQQLVLTVSHVSDTGKESLIIGGQALDISTASTGTAVGSYSADVALNSGTATVTLDLSGGNHSVTDVQSLITSMKYRNEATPLTEANRVVTLTTIQDDGGTANGGLDTVNGLTLSSTVSALNNSAPVATDTSVTLSEDTPYTFSLVDFGFSDSDTGDSLHTLKITQLPALGQLLLNGNAVTQNMEITQDQLTQGALTYTAATNNFGQNYSQFSVQVSDGTVFSDNSATVTLSVNAMNDAPEGQPVINGLAEVAQILTADTSGIQDIDGLGVLRYQWLRDGTAIQGAQLARYEVTETDAGAQISLLISYQDQGGTIETVRSASTAPVTLIEPTTPNTPPTDPETPPTSDDDNDGISASEEDAVTSLNGFSRGDGNGDGAPDSQQVNVASKLFRKTDQVSNNPDADTISVTLDARNPDDPAVVVHLRDVGQMDAPEDKPDTLSMPLGLIEFKADVTNPGDIQHFSLLVDPQLPVNGYWKQLKTGQWVNLASELYGGSVTTVGQKTQVNFFIQDGGVFDDDGVADGVITDPGALGYQEPSANPEPLDPFEGTDAGHYFDWLSLG